MKETIPSVDASQTFLLKKHDFTQKKKIEYISLIQL